MTGSAHSLQCSLHSSRGFGDGGLLPLQLSISVVHELHHYSWSKSSRVLSVSSFCRGRTSNQSHTRTSVVSCWSTVRSLDCRLSNGEILVIHLICSPTGPSQASFFSVDPRRVGDSVEMGGGFIHGSSEIG